MKNTLYSWCNSLKKKKKEGMLQENAIAILDTVAFEWEISKKKEKMPVKDTQDDMREMDNTELESDVHVPDVQKDSGKKGEKVQEEQTNILVPDQKKDGGKKG